MTRGRRRERGQSMVEMALVLPLFLVIVMATIDFGWALRSYIVITNAAREGARAGVVGATEADIQGRVASKSNGLLDVADVTVTNAESAPGTELTVRVDYEHEYISPLGPLLNLISGGAMPDPPADVEHDNHEDGVTMGVFERVRDRIRGDGERGQIVLLTAAMLTVVLVFSALAIDVGFWIHTRTKLQADADAMALAGAQKLCAQLTCDSDAVALATSYGGLNDVSNAEIMDVVVGESCGGATSTNHDMLTVRTQRTVPTFLAKLIGIVDQDIDTCATARKAAVAGGTGIVPFGIEDQCLGVGDFGAPYDLKYDSDPDSTFEGCDKFGGNFGLLSIDTSGAGSGCGSPPDSTEELKLKVAICFGANRFLCAQAATDCVGQADDDSCSGDHAADDESCTEPGNTTSAIKEGLGFRMANTTTECDTWEEVTFPTGGLRPRCNPWLHEDSKRVIMIPVVDGLFEGSGGTKIIEIVNFAVFFLEDFEGKDCKGSDCDVVGRFIVTSLTASYEGLTELSADSSLTVVTLVD